MLFWIGRGPCLLPERHFEQQVGSDPEEFALSRDG
jgi:hypothetical protein